MLWASLRKICKLPLANFMASIKNYNISFNSVFSVLSTTFKSCPERVRSSKWTALSLTRNLRFLHNGELIKQLSLLRSEPSLVHRHQRDPGPLPHAPAGVSGSDLTS